MPVMDVRPIGSAGFDVVSAAGLFRRLVADGAALGWVDPPSVAEVTALLGEVTAAARDSDAALAVVVEDDRVVGLGYWMRYARPTHRPHADIEKVAVDPDFQGRGIGRRLMVELIAAARAARVEVLTLDLRADNERAVALYESVGFRRYGRLADFVAVGERRWDKLFYALDLRRL
jgi:ribosomal protein S18 acetylase RimI-like enzyme